MFFLGECRGAPTGISAFEPDLEGAGPCSETGDPALFERLPERKPGPETKAKAAGAAPDAALAV